MTSASSRAARNSRPGSPRPGGGARSAEPPATQPTRPAVESDKNRICIARIGAAHGTSGQVRLWPFTAEPQAVSRYGALETADGARSFEIEAVRPAKDCLIARLKGVTDRSAAERLCNLDLYVPRERLPVAQHDEFYHADLIGLAVEDAGGNAIGTVVAVHNFGAGDLLEIAPASGGDTVMLAFTAAVVPRVEIAAGRIILDPDLFERDSPSAQAPTPPRKRART